MRGKVEGTKAGGNKTEGSKAERTKAEGEKAERFNAKGAKTDGTKAKRRPKMRWIMPRWTILRGDEDKAEQSNLRG